MRQFIPIILIVLTFTSCDCVQKAKGIVIDRQTNKPIISVSIGKYQKDDIANARSKRVYTDENGRFDFHSISGGFGSCPDLVLYFNKEGYETCKMTFTPTSFNDTVFLDKVPSN